MVSGLLAFLIALVLYWPTVMPGVGFWDTAEFQTVGPVLGIAHPTGFPSYVLLTWAANLVLSPLGNTAFRIDLFSAILVAAASGLLAATVHRLTGRTVPALASGLLLAVAPITWWTAERADPHALHLFLSAALLYLLVAWAQRVRQVGALADDPGDQAADRLLLAASAVYAVALGNHALTVLLAPGILALLLAVQPRLFTRRRRLVAACAGLIVTLTAVLYAYIPIRASMHPPLDYAHPTTLGRFAYVVLGLQFRGLLTNPLTGGPGPVVDFFATSLSMAVVVVALAGFAAALLRVGRLRSLGRPVAALTGTWFVAVTIFARAYNDGFPDRYYLVPIAMLALWAGVAAALAWDAAASVGLRAWRRLSTPPAYGSAPGRSAAVRGGIRAGRTLRVTGVLIAAIVVLGLPAQRAFAERSAQSDAAGDQGAQWLNAAYAILPRDAVVLSWWSYSTPLWYGRWVEGRRPDVQIVDDRNLLDDGFGTLQNAIRYFEAERRPIFLIRQLQDIPGLETHYHLIQYDTIPGYSPLWEIVQ
ncbi:MAG: protein O-mannosyl-transferase family [Candidatus Limnocylindrales bacterium]